MLTFRFPDVSKVHTHTHMEYYLSFLPLPSDGPCSQDLTTRLLRPQNPRWIRGRRMQETMMMPAAMPGEWMKSRNG